ncbi:MAG TPA: DUF4400 domain-containing protein [Burkholderiaceae bacterium]|nr:DUF4400 domain-containing protein [Burkholderiaceae bacterium]
MLRILSGVALLSIIVIALYLPSQFPARTFYEQLRAEHETNERFWGDAHADAILDRALAIDEKVVKAPDAVAPAVVIPRPPTDPLSRTNLKLTEMRERFISSSYVQGLRATLLLAEYRVSALLQWGPAVLMFMVLAVLDGLVVRLVSSCEFGDYSPVKFGAFGFALIGFLWLVVVSFMLPTAVHPLFYGIAPVLLAILMSTVVANVHRNAMRPHNIAA